MYYVLERFNRKEKEMFLDGIPYDNLNQEITSNIFKDGKRLGDFPEQIIVILDEKESNYKNQEKLDKITIFMSGLGAGFLVSEKVKEFLTGGNIQNLEFIKARIRGLAIEINDYYFVNVIGKVQCVDKEKTDASYFKASGNLKSVESLALNEALIPEGLDIFILAESNSPFIIVSEEFKNRLESNGFKGFFFTKPEDYRTY